MYIGVPLGNILVPLMIWLLKKNDLPLVDEQGKQSLNFQISFMLYAFITAIIYLILALIMVVNVNGVAPTFFILSIPLIIVLFLVTHLAFTIVASIKASNGEVYRYPLAINFFK